MSITGEDRIFKFCLTVFVVLFTFKSIYGQSVLYEYFMFLVAATAIVMMIKGFIEILLYGDHQAFSSGGAIAVMMVILFNGLPYMITAALFMFGIPLALVSALL